MTYDIVLYRVLGLVFTVMSVGLLLNRKHFQEMAASLVKTPATHFPATFVPLLVGAILVVTHNIWIWDYCTLVTLIGWGLFLGGLFRALFPAFWIDMVAKHHTKPMLTFVFLLVLIIGIVLLYAGFFA